MGCLDDRYVPRLDWGQLGGRGLEIRCGVQKHKVIPFKYLAGGKPMYNLLVEMIVVVNYPGE